MDNTSRLFPSPPGPESINRRIIYTRYDIKHRVNSRQFEHPANFQNDQAMARTISDLISAGLIKLAIDV